MKTPASDLVVLIDSSREAVAALRRLTFIPPLRVVPWTRLPQDEDLPEDPLMLLLGEIVPPLPAKALVDWLDRLHRRVAPPVALLVPRRGDDWAPATTHPQFCGLLPYRPEVSIEQMERVMRVAREARTRRPGWGDGGRAWVSWTLPVREAADSEQIWLRLEAALSGALGSRTDLSRLGMAFNEALTNAVEHGCLNLGSKLKEPEPDGLLRFFEERERRLRSPSHGDRTITIRADLRQDSLRIRIRHDGIGFDPSGVRATPVTESSTHGHGLAMMRALVDSVGFSHDGRTVTLVHRLPRLREPQAAGRQSVLHDDGPEQKAA